MNEREGGAYQDEHIDEIVHTTQLLIICNAS